MQANQHIDRHFRRHYFAWKDAANSTKNKRHLTREKHLTRYEMVTVKRGSRAEWSTVILSACDAPAYCWRLPLARTISPIGSSYRGRYVASSGREGASSGVRSRRWLPTPWRCWPGSRPRRRRTPSPSPSSTPYVQRPHSQSTSVSRSRKYKYTENWVSRE